MRCIQVSVAVAALVALAGATHGQFQEQYIWQSLKYEWAHDSSRAQALDKELVNPDNIILSRIKIWRDRIYLTLPRWKNAVAATLVSIPVSGSNPSPLLEPFPSWQMQTVGNCSALQSVHAIEIEPNGRMWILDTGIINTLGNDPDVRCPPKMVLVDLSDSVPKIVRTVMFPDSVVSRSLLVNIVLDSDGIAYISDTGDTDPGIIVFNATDGHMWKVRDTSMRAGPVFKEQNQKFPSNVNALALTPVPTGNDVNRTLYYSCLGSYDLYAINTSFMRSQDTATTNNIHEYIVNLGNKTSYSQDMIIDSYGVMYLGLNSMDSVAVWNTRKLPLKDHIRVFSKDPVRMQWPSGFAFDNEGSLWVISNKFKDFLAGTINWLDTNYRVMRTVTNSSSYLFPEVMSTEQPDEPTHSDHMHMNHQDHDNHGNHNQSTDHRNAAETVTKPASTLLAILVTISTFVVCT